jgi:hypothetical protein
MPDETTDTIVITGTFSYTGKREGVGRERNPRAERSGVSISYRQ